MSVPKYYMLRIYSSGFVKIFAPASLLQRIFRFCFLLPNVQAHPNQRMLQSLWISIKILKRKKYEKNSIRLHDENDAAGIPERIKSNFAFFLFSVLEYFHIKHFIHIWIYHWIVLKPSYPFQSHWTLFKFKLQ